MTEDKKKVLYILGRGLLDIRNAARKRAHFDAISKISHLLHNVPSALTKFPADQVYNRLVERAKELDCEQWLQTAVHEYEINRKKS